MPPPFHVSVRWRRLFVAACTIVLGVLTSACSETVGFVTLQTSAPDWQPELQCADDPRRSAEIRVVARCGDEAIEAATTVDSHSLALRDVPLGDCELSVEALNQHGRVVLGGSVLTSIVRGENPQIDVPLLEVECDLACDADRDGIASADEEAMGLDPSLADSDGDGLEDGLELQQCCSAPDRPSQDCKLLIRGVTPLVGPPGRAVVVLSTSELSDPAVTVGGAPLAEVLADSTAVFGTVAATALLGPIELTSDGERDRFDSLFATLLAEPETVFELDQKAGARSGLMQSLVDLQPTAEGVLLLGQGRIDRQMSPVLLSINRRPVRYSRNLLGGRGAPVALAATGDRLAVLLRDGTSASLIATGLTGTDTASRRIDLGTVDAPMDVVLTPNEQVAIVLFRQGLMRLSLAGNETPTLVPLPLLRDTALATLQEPNAQRAVSGCSGIAYDEADQAVYLSCNLPAARCDADTNCPLRGAVLRIAPIDRCLPTGTTRNLGQDCLASFFAASNESLAGAPLVDRQARRVYALGTRGISSAPTTTTTGVHQLSPLVPFLRQGQSTANRLMALNDSGQLFVADGVLVRRLEPRAQSASQRLGHSFFVGNEDERAMMLALPPDGASLEVGRTGQLPSLATVCLSRCPTCACR